MPETVASPSLVTIGAGVPSTQLAYERLQSEGSLPLADDRSRYDRTAADVPFRGAVFRDGWIPCEAIFVTGSGSGAAPIFKYCRNTVGLRLPE
ncbi:glutamate racemase [Anopheles sinensis]|uniref:Glutamate racemase n=1 Tax=Anopheles sinensis TaxID=74873 RepID=A0A084W4M4_ANOSI|nr:glutamate racemase [Anopheles sinensis]